MTDAKKVLTCPRCRRVILTEWDVGDFETCKLCGFEFLIGERNVPREARKQEDSND